MDYCNNQVADSREEGWSTRICSWQSRDLPTTSTSVWCSRWS